MRKVRSSFIGLLILLGACCHCIFLSARAVAAEDLSGWHFYADATVSPQADDSYDAVYADFTRLMKRDLKQRGALEENSIRVAPLENGQPAAVVPSRFIKAKDYDAANNAAGTLVFLVHGSEKAGARQYRIFFDTQANGPKPAAMNDSEIPAAANMVWNAGFEILSAGYKGANRYANAGAKMPHGWWGNLRAIADNAAVTARSGKNALAFVAPEMDKNIGLGAAPSPPGLRVRAGENYTFSFWAMGAGITPSRRQLVASVYWYGEDQKYLQRETIGDLPQNLADFSWRQSEISLVPPPEAHFAMLRILTYSTTGLITVDDLEVRLAVPPLLENAQKNQ